MRQNLVFYGFKEEKNETDNDCEKKIRNLIVSNDMLSGNVHVQMDRCHRLGKPQKADSSGQTSSQNFKPRPIVCRMTHYKDKQMILENGKKLKGSEIRISEQYSKLTRQMHSSMYQKCKAAKESSNSCIEKFYIKYQYAAIYSKSGKRRNVDLDRMLEDPNWCKIF